ncbi:MAG: glycoside hydrolase family 3 C-terminal domain-containing protein [Clostridiales bacterium]|nr:glycoside hydrolase family 3 C-terminal domain-containing protein [Clostridiales bacterium]
MAKNDKPKKEKKQGTGVVKWSVITVVAVILCVALVYANTLAFGSAQVINIYLGISTTKTVDGDDSAVYYETGYDSTEELEAHDKEIAEQLAGEGIVLLKNDNDALPLASGSAVSTFSHSVVDIVTCGTGSADIDTSAAPTLKEALEDVGFSVNSTLWDFYETGAGSEYVRAPGKGSSLGSRGEWNINEVPVSVYTDDVTASFSEYNDAAIVVLSRVAGEGSDLAMDGFVDGTNVLELTTEEQEMLEMVGENFDTVIVLINSTNAMECDFIDNEAYGIDAALWIGYTGTWGLNSVADILVGNTNPSGRLVDTYCYDNTTAPSVVSMYGYTWANFDETDTDNWDEFCQG